MALPASGAISLSQVATELGVAASNVSLNLANVRALAGKTSGAISLGDLRGKSSVSAVNQNVVFQRATLGYNSSVYIITERVNFAGFTFVDGSKPSAIQVVSLSGATATVSAFTVTTNSGNATRTLQVRLTSSTGLTALVQYVGPLGQFHYHTPNDFSNSVAVTVLGT